uniref:RPAP3_C domain-containing protein n=1 Tax=Mesocestoides corti TaxID=53468 RepID=A0A5K3F7G2_MESCO
MNSSTACWTDSREARGSRLQCSFWKTRHSKLWRTSSTGSTPPPYQPPTILPNSSASFHRRHFTLVAVIPCDK